MINELADSDLQNFRDHGFCVFPNAVSHAVIDGFKAHFDECWESSPAYCFAMKGDEVVRLVREQRHLYDKVSDLHYGFAEAGELIFSSRVLGLLRRFFGAEPVVFQSVAMERSIETPFHQDEKLLPLSGGSALVGCWIALADVLPGSGEFEFIPGSHLLGEVVLTRSEDKAHLGRGVAFEMAALTTHALNAGLQPAKFQAKKGDVLVWSNLLHRAAPAQDPTLSRHCLICHMMPSGARPLFYESAHLEEAAYPCGGLFLDRFQTAGRFIKPLHK